MIKVDKSKVLEYLEFKQKCIAEENPNILKNVNHDCYHRLMMDHKDICLLDYAVTRSPHRIRENVRKAVGIFVPYLYFNIAIRNTPRPYSPYDPGALADVWFEKILVLYTILESRKEILGLCEKTSYGRYIGKPKLNSHWGIVSRMIRSFYLEDPDWLEEEVESLKTCSVCGMSDPCMWIPKKRWHPLFYSLFFGDEDNFHHHVVEITKWYRKLVYRDFVNERNEVSPYALINRTLLFAIKIANTHRGYNIQIKDDFLPYDIVNFS